ncbi:MAG: hypothetical protein OEY52_02380 [Gammaproteobacteria bacterium]|nr:hypothetical protein [Gammaproteobacteria bacterium]
MLPVVCGLTYMSLTLIESKSFLLELIKLFIVSVAIISYGALLLVWFFSGPGPMDRFWDEQKQENNNITLIEAAKKKINIFAAYLIIIVTPVFCIVVIYKYYVHLFNVN